MIIGKNVKKIFYKKINFYRSLKFVGTVSISSASIISLHVITELSIILATTRGRAPNIWFFSLYFTLRPTFIVIPFWF